MYYDGPIDYYDSGLKKRVIVRSWSFNQENTLAAMVFPGERRFCRVRIADKITEFDDFKSAWRFFFGVCKAESEVA